MRRKLHLGQDNPRDQLRAAIGAIEGNLLNLEDGDSTPENVVRNIRTILRVVKLTLPHLDGVEWRQDKPMVEE